MATRSDNGAFLNSPSMIEGEQLRKLAFGALHLLCEEKNQLARHNLNAIYHVAVFGDDFAWSELVHGNTSKASWLETIIPEIAQLLGQDWLDDRLSFAQVTLASSRLQQAARACATHYRKDFFVSGARPTALIIVPPSCDHTLGAVTMASLLLARGIHATTMLRARQEDVRQKIATHDFDGVFLSWSYPESLENAQKWIVKLKSVCGSTTRFGVGGTLLAIDNETSIPDADLCGNEIEDAANLCRTSFAMRTNSKPF